MEQDLVEYIERFFNPAEIRIRDGRIDSLGEANSLILRHFFNEYVYKNIPRWDTEKRYRELYAFYIKIKEDDSCLSEPQSPEELSGLLIEKHLELLEEMIARFLYIRHQLLKANKEGKIKLIH